MTDAGADESIDVSLLIPHPRRTAVLVAAAGAPSGTASPPPRMPTLRLAGDEPLLSEILDATDVVDADTAVVLRQVLTSPDGVDDSETDEMSLVVEFDAVPEAPSGWAWQDLEDEVIARLEPPTARAAVAAWARERAEGWSPLRPAWSLPGWFARASAWMVEQMAADGRPAVGPPRQHQLWGLSVVLRAPSVDGDSWFKCSTEIFRHEAAMTQALSRQMPDRAPHVVAVDAEHGWMLMRDLGAAELGHQDESLWHEGVAALAGVQQRWLGRTAELLELGLPDRSLADLAVRVEEMTEDDVLLGRLSADLRERWVAAAPALIESCRRLDELGPGPTLVHGDFHPWNIAFGPDATRVFDWTDAAVSHPFVDLATYVFRTKDRSVRERMVEACVRAWSELGEERTLREAAALGLVVGAVYQVQTYRLLLPTLVGYGADDGLSSSDAGWVRRSLTRHADGLGSPD